MKNKRTLRLCEAGVIAGAYAALTYLASAFNLAYGPIQFRFSEALTILPLFTPAAIPGLTVGCVVANLGSSLGWVDIVCGSVATLLAAILTRTLRKVRIRSLPFWAFIPPILFNAVIVGLELTFLLSAGEPFFKTFMFNFATVGLGEVVVVFVLGIPLYYALKKSGIFTKIGEGEHIHAENSDSGR
ncbi:MAG: QueT transporter family protein [Clostridiales bacterium]|nr:QueT transporter family protein [Clostridiales bacterium]